MSLRFTDKDFAKIITQPGYSIQSEFGAGLKLPPIEVPKILAHKNTPDGDFDSGEEYERWCTLKLWQSAGVISRLERQIEYMLQEAFTDKTGYMHRAITYTADFRYYDELMKVEVVEDYKGYIRPAFRRTKKLLLKCYPELNFFVNTDIKGVYKP